jgi:DNA-binding MarR family transcriptional regulator
MINNPALHFLSMAAPRWLDDEEMDFWRGFIDVTTAALTDIENALKADAGLAFDDYEVLVHLSEADERRIRMNELSELLLNSRSRLTQRVDRLETRGLVAREKCPGDKRGTFAVLTDEGFALLEQAAPKHLVAVRERLIDRLDRQQIRHGSEIFAALRTAVPQVKPAD